MVVVPVMKRRLKKKVREHATTFIEGRERVYITFGTSEVGTPMRSETSNVQIV